MSYLRGCIRMSAHAFGSRLKLEISDDNSTAQTGHCGDAKWRQNSRTRSEQTRHASVVYSGAHISLQHFLSLLVLPSWERDAKIIETNIVWCLHTGNIQLTLHIMLDLIFVKSLYRTICAICAISTFAWVPHDYPMLHLSRKPPRLVMWAMTYSRMRLKELKYVQNERCHK